MELIGLFVPAVLIVIVLLLFSGLRVIQEYERGVIFRLGRLAGSRRPGLTYVIPGFERMVKIDLRVITMDVPAQAAIPRGNVTVRVHAVVYLLGVDPDEDVVRVLAHIRADVMNVQPTLRSVHAQ